jgi:hypothetical protein
MEPDPSKPATPKGKPTPAEPQPVTTGSGAASALARLKVWERGRAKLRESSRGKPGNKVGGGGN